MDLCGHKGFAGPSACILEEGHYGNHQYGDIATAYEVELRKDAERYRFLREAAHDAAKIEALNMANREPQTPAEFDAAVDIAMTTPNVEVQGRDEVQLWTVLLECPVGRKEE